MRGKGTVCLALLSLVWTGRLEAQEDPPHRAGTFVWRSMGRGYLGVQVQGMTPELRAHFGAPEDEGVLVSKVDDGGPAEAAGILVGDIITAVDAQPIGSPMSLSHAIRGMKKGDSVSIELLRDETAMSFTVSIDERDKQVFNFAEYPLLLDRHELPDSDVTWSLPGMRLDPEAMEAFQNAMRELSERFESGAWKEKLERIQTLDLSRVEERMKEVEKRLEELEKELAKEPNK